MHTTGTTIERERERTFRSLDAAVKLMTGALAHIYSFHVFCIFTIVNKILTRKVLVCSHKDFLNVFARACVCAFYSRWSFFISFSRSKNHSMSPMNLCLCKWNENKLRWMCDMQWRGYTQQTMPNTLALCSLCFCYSNLCNTINKFTNHSLGWFVLFEHDFCHSFKFGKVSLVIILHLNEENFSANV